MYRRLVVPALGLFCFAMPAIARADAVLDWNVIAVNTAIANGQNPFFQARTSAVVQLAVFEAVNAITQEYEPYLGTIGAADGASAEAAAIAAAHRVLRTYFAGSAVSLDAARASSLAAIPDGQPKTDGIATGEAAAAAMIALRANDGSLPAEFYVPAAPATGVWEATPSCPLDSVSGIRRGILLQWRNVAPFGIPSAADFMPGPPPEINSSRYLKDYNEVMTMGDVNSLARPQDRSDVARFYGASSPTYLFSMVARQAAAARGDTLSENARALALIAMAINDSLVTSFLTKYHYDLWRPETAIRAAATDGNDKTEPNVAFLPFILTPCFPSYPSNHASGSNGGAEMLRRLYGAGGHTIELSNPLVPSIAAITLRYGTFKEICKDVDDARVYGGIHFRFDQDAGNRIGQSVATHVYKHNLRKVNGSE